MHVHAIIGATFIYSRHAVIICFCAITINTGVVSPITQAYLGTVLQLSEICSMCTCLCLLYCFSYRWLFLSTAAEPIGCTSARRLLCPTASPWAAVGRSAPKRLIPYRPPRAAVGKGSPTRLMTCLPQMGSSSQGCS